MVVAVRSGCILLSVDAGLDGFVRFWTLLDAIWVVAVSFGCYVLGLAVGLDQNFTKSTENASNFSLSPEKRDFRTLRKSEICENMRKCDQMGELGTLGRVRI